MGMKVGILVRSIFLVVHVLNWESGRGILF
jgi:hypothetical protein